MFENLVKIHPAYQELKDLLLRNQAKDKYLPFVELSGLTFSLYNDLINSLAKSFNRSVISIQRDDAELRKYFEFGILVDIYKTKYTDLIRIVHDYGLERVQKIETTGQYSFKGDVFSIWPPGMDNPIRISYFDTQVESAVVYDEIYGKSYGNISSFFIGDLNKIETKSLLNYVKVTNYEAESLNSVIIFGGDIFDNYESKGLVRFDFVLPTLYFNRFDILEHEVKKKASEGYKIEIYTKHFDALPKSLESYVKSDKNLDSGFISSEIKTLILSDKELFGTVYLSNEANKMSSQRARKILANLEGEIEIGDYVVHSEHGIGIYNGLKEESYIKEILVGVGEKIQREFKEDYILIKYAEDDELYVPLRQIDKLTKYISVDDQDPQITRLGKKDWEAIRKKTREDIFLMAKELVLHYALREVAKAPQISSETDDDYEEFVSNFPYKETPDQLQTEREVLKDIASDKPMNRLVVGDVGFGKTEIAMRAAYKVVKSGKQVCVLCPTTVLTAQHEKVFNDRYRGTGVNIKSLSRINKKEEIDTLKKLETGEVDILIGTHRILSNDIKFKDLGLIVIDEEQKFGVKQKEELKKIEYGVHVLSMSATPIPRSLSMALSSIQDISIIQTPPENRKAVKNIVSKYDKFKVKNAIEFELKRSGQIYYVYNKVETILSKAYQIKKLIPGINLVVAHGQMTPNELRKNVSEFYQKQHEVLLCTTIIENGIDMPNVNTIIIENAQNFGLGQMYQLRGRVGRGEKQGYAYFFYDGEDIDLEDESREAQIKTKSDLLKLGNRRKYKKRLKAIQEANELGAGFSLASRDLEIRGAGNLLGKQQHGNIKHIGYALYMQMLAEEIEKLKHE